MPSAKPCCYYKNIVRSLCCTIKETHSSINHAINPSHTSLLPTLWATGFYSMVFFHDQWKRATLILWLTMLVDVDHLLATPLFNACRCSINFHPLHSYPAIALYVVLFFIPRCRIIAIGLILHMATDQLDCFLNLYTCP